MKYKHHDDVTRLNPIMRLEELKLHASNPSMFELELLN